MALITTATERMARPSHDKGLIVGPSGIGKTSLLWTLDPDTTLFIDLEAGDKAVEGWAGDSIDVIAYAKELGLHPWAFCQALACVIGGADPAKRPDEAYSQAHYDYALGTIGPREQFDKYKTLFVDSITVAGRHSFHWCQGQPEAFSEKTGKPNPLGAYGLHGREMLKWLTQIQHVRHMSVWFLAILDKAVDDFGRTTYSPQIEGSKVGREMPGIVDQVISMIDEKTEAGQSYRAFVCHTLNPKGYPAKDRSGRLDMIEEPHLGKLMEKMRVPDRKDEHVYGLPGDEPADTTTPVDPAPETQAAA